MITRRQFIVSATASIASNHACRAWASAQADIGSAEIMTLSDGHLVLPESFLYGDLATDQVDAVLSAANAAAGGLEPPCNLTLFRRGDALVLFDAGSGPSFMPTAGKLPEALGAAGVSPDEITHVIFTHGHPDHLWGVLDDFDEPFFPNATHLMGEEELAYWTDPDTLETIAPERQSFAAGASRRLGLRKGRIETFRGGDTVLPGVTAIATPGHTPGHMSFEVTGETGRVLLIGDAIGNGHVALRRPEWHAPADQDPETGAATRIALLQRIAEAETLSVGFHLPGDGLGRIIRDGDAYAWSPA
ncbi:MBL fold metallo-hydrolase [Palleronia pelagia]|uniref:Glyoxylase, beta-lactamase superfamily II n=1 Tax=Palleronia pelagia TaxID=387096 RepID=A0A1H8LNA4_9RHOB|nr:MBL fold metallo-hydrolase [Palleronia pelagia]SEO06493.1 Glyoxylase, beta-lactamase superfamily II [Palleronia pelagia]